MGGSTPRTGSVALLVAIMSKNSKVYISPFALLACSLSA